MEIKRQDIDNDELAMMFVAFSKKLFQRPQVGDIYSIGNENGCTLHFRLEYHKKLMDELKSAHESAKFQESNASSDWISLMKVINSAELISDFDTKGLTDYVEEVSPYWPK